MSLVAWYPLDGDMKNYGVGDMDLAVSKTPTFAAGKIGKALSGGGTATWTAEQTAKVLNNEHVSICFWMKVVDTNNRPMIFGTDSMSANNNRKFSIFQYPTANDLHLSWQNDEASKEYYQSVEGGFFPTGEWVHCAITYENPAIKIYKNGSLFKTYSGVSSSSTFAYQTQVFRESTSRLLNDFRFYNHCLSAKEVKEISKGLVLHYPLSSIYSTSLINKYNGDAARGFPARYRDSRTGTTYGWADDGSYHITLNYTGNGNDSWWSFTWPTFSFTSGKKHWYSFDIKGIKSANLSLQLRASRCRNDWATNKVNCVFDGTWHRMSVSQTLTSGTLNKDGKDVTVNPVLECYTSNMKTADAVYTADFYIKNVQVVESDVDVPFIMNDFQDNIVYDCSGYKNNGTTIGTTNWTSDTPIGQGAVNFIGNTCINAGTGGKVTDTITVNCWANFSNWAVGGLRPISCTEGGGWNFELNNGKLGFALYKSGVGYNNAVDTNAASTISSGWHMLTGTYDGHVSKLYLDGALRATGNNTEAKTLIGYNSVNAVFIAAESGSNATTPASYSPDCKISDVRVYATALSPTDIQELYQTRFTIADNGTLFCDEIVEDGDKVSFGENGVASVGEICSGVGRRNLYYIYDLNNRNRAKVASYSVTDEGINLTANGADLYIGEVMHVGNTWGVFRGPLMDVTDTKQITFSISDPLFTKNFYNFLDADKKALSEYTYLGKSSGTFDVPSGAKYLTMRFGYGSATSGTTYSFKIKVEKGSGATPWTPALEDTIISQPEQVTKASIYDNAILAREIIER